MGRSVSRRHIQSPNRLGVAALVAVALTLTACGSGGVTPPPSQAVVGSPSSAASAAAQPSAAPTASGGVPSASTGTAAGPGQSGATPGIGVILPANVCDILDPATIMSVTGLSVHAGVPVKGTSTEIGSCNWDATSTTGVSVTAYPTAFIQSKLQVMPANFTIVPGVGNLAKGQLGGTGPLKTAVIFADLGSFGLRLAVHSPAATMDEATQLVQAVK